MLVSATEPDRSPTNRDDADDWLRTERNEALLEADHWRSVAEDERTGRVRAEAELAATRTMLDQERTHGDRLEAQLAEARKPALVRLLEAFRRR